MKMINRIFVVVTLFLLFGATAYAEEAAQAPAAGMDPAMTEKMKAIMAPGEAHKALEPLVGKWNYTGIFKMTPEGQPVEMKGTATHTMVYGGRFLKQEIQGPWMGENFEGLGYTGYDNIKKEYESVWLDSMGTGMMKVSGTFDFATKTLSQSGENSCPLTGETHRKGRSEWKMTDKDHSTYSSYLLGPDGQEFKAMELNYTRLQE